MRVSIFNEDFAIIIIGKRDLYHIVSGLRAEIFFKVELIIGPILLIVLPFNDTEI
jgi:hypothetical protein